MFPFLFGGVNFPGLPSNPVGYMIPSAGYNHVNYGLNGVGGKYPNNKVRTLFMHISISDKTRWF